MPGSPAQGSRPKSLSEQPKAATACLSTRYAFSIGEAWCDHRHGGGDRTRTCDILLAKQELYQLSYAPAEWWAYVDSNHRPYAYQAYALTT